MFTNPIHLSFWQVQLPWDGCSHHHITSHRGTHTPCRVAQGKFPSWAISQNNLRPGCHLEYWGFGRAAEMWDTGVNVLATASTGLQQEPGDAQRHPLCLWHYKPASLKVTCSAVRTRPWSQQLLQQHEFLEPQCWVSLWHQVHSSLRNKATVGTNAPASCWRQAESQCQLCLTSPRACLVQSTQPPPCSSRKHPKNLFSSLEH